ncbi:TPA: translation initiation factor IF-2, partial [Candidatus Bathyarchaeota archaeon]|nr:translation initiation factor IF-2 [Candidatus Bathyarchaeota archaeon]
GVVLSFNVNVLPDAREEAKRFGVPVFESNIIYRLIEDYTEWVRREKALSREAALSRLIKPGKIKVLEGYVFRRSKPAIVGVEVLRGSIKPKYPLIREDGQPVGEILRIQDRGKDVNEARAGMQVAISVDKGIVGRNINEGDALYVSVPDDHASELLTEFKDGLTEEEISLLEEVAKIKARTRG